MVTEGNREAWAYDPFGAEIVDGRMYGRGTNDTKGNLACMITACQSLLLDQEAFTGKIILCIPCDEEGLMLGIKHFIKMAGLMAWMGRLSVSHRKIMCVLPSVGLFVYK